MLGIMLIRVVAQTVDHGLAQHPRNGTFRREISLIQSFNHRHNALERALKGGLHIAQRHIPILRHYPRIYRIVRFILFGATSI